MFPACGVAAMLFNFVVIFFSFVSFDLVVIRLNTLGSGYRGVCSKNEQTKIPEPAWLIHVLFNKQRIISISCRSI